MSARNPPLAALLLAAALVSCASVPVEHNALGAPYRASSLEAIETAELQWQPVSNGVTGIFFKIEKPRLEAWALRIGLSQNGLEPVMNAPTETSRQIPAIKTSSFLREYGCIAALNAGPFAPVSSKEGEPRALTGVFVSQGALIAPPDPRYAALLFFADGTGAIIRQSAGYPWTRPELRYAAGGFAPLLENGALAAVPERAARHPRSAAGLSHNGTVLYLLAIDGRRMGSAGATELETARILKALGAENALNLDGGGSTALVLRKNGKPALVNRVSGLRERAVATCIGIREQVKNVKHGRSR